MSYTDNQFGDEDDDEQSCKIVLLGESGVGKTSIIANFMEQNTNDISATTGATFSTKTINFDKFNKNVCFEIWDTAGQEKYRALTKMFYKDAAAAILVYDITREESFQQLKEYWAVQVKENAPKKIIFAIAANKSDLEDSEAINEIDAREFAKSINALFKKTSCIRKEGIDELFNDIGYKFLDPNYEVSAEAKLESEERRNIKRASVKITNKKKETEQTTETKKKKCC